MPRVGITLGASRMDEYERAVIDAGGEPVRLASRPGAAASDCDGLAGIVLTGGLDVDPARYDEPAHPLTERAAPERDAYETELVRVAFARGLPTLAICRGIQVANVALGGSLEQHVPDVAGSAIPHSIEGPDGTYRGIIDAHVVATVAGSRLAAIAGTSFATGSRHHQAIARVADPFRVVGRTPDGVVEAIEACESGRFWLGLQWHPESTVTLDDGVSRGIFAAFVSAAR